MVTEEFTGAKGVVGTEGTKAPPQSHGSLRVPGTIVVIRGAGPLGLQTADPLVLIFLAWKPSK